MSTMLRLRRLFRASACLLGLLGGTWVPGTVARAAAAAIAPPEVAPPDVVAPSPGPPAVRVNGLLQPQALLEQDAVTVAQRTLRWSPFIRRARLSVQGDLRPGINFFVQGDVPNTGLHNDWRPRYFLNDAVVEFVAGAAMQLDVGLLLLPTSHATASGTPTVMGVNAPLVFFTQEVSAVTADETILPSQQAMRDVGAMVRGLLGDGRVEYRLALTAGLSKFVGGSVVNPHALPRLTGRLVYNFFAPEVAAGFPGFFYPGISLQEQAGQLVSPKKMLSLGLSASVQPDALVDRDGQTPAFGLLDVDLYFDLPMRGGTAAWTGQVDYAIYRIAPQARLLRHLLFAELGYRLGRLQPVAALEYVKNQGSFAEDSLYWRAGINWWIAGHTVNVKVDGGARRQGNQASGGGNFLFIGHLATQVFF